MKNSISLLIFLFSISLVNAQSINGKVLDNETKGLMEGVHVYTQKQKNVTLTNKKGKFKLRFQTEIKENDTIYFSYLGYKVGYTLYKMNKKNYLFYLERDVNNLNTVTIQSNKKLKPFIDYKTLNPMKKGLHSFGSTLIDDKIYVLGGDETYGSKGVSQVLKNYDVVRLDEGMSLAEILSRNKDFSQNETFNSKLSVYDVKLDKWTVQKSEFKKRSNHNINYNKTNHKIYVLGGVHMSPNKNMKYLDNQIEVYSPKENTIEIDNTNPHQAVNFESFMYHDNIIVMGGSVKKYANGTVEYSKKVHAYNTKTGYWFELDDMITAKEVKGDLVGDKIYVFGGNRYGKRSEFETYDLMTGKWKEEGNMFTKLENPAITHKGNIIYLFEEGKIFTYNIIAKELKQYTIGLQLRNSKIHYINENIYIIGGYVETDEGFIPSKEMYSINLDEFDITKVKKYQQF